MRKVYKVIVGGTVIYTTSSKEKAEEELFRAKNSFLAMVHPRNCFYIKEEEK